MSIDLKSSANVNTIDPAHEVAHSGKAAARQNRADAKKNELPSQPDSGMASTAADITTAFEKIAAKTEKMPNPFKKFDLLKLQLQTSDAAQEVSAMELATRESINHLLGDVKTAGQQAILQIREASEVSLSSLTDSAIESGVKNIAQDLFAMFKNSSKS